MQTEVSHFNQVSDDYLKEYGKITAEGYSFRIRREKTLSLIPQTVDKTEILDVGCGPGIMVKSLLSRGYNVTCVDPAPKMIELVKRDFGSNPDVRAEVGNVYELNFPDNSFEFITAMGLIEYLEDQAKAFTELRRVLKNNGNLIITFPNKTSPWRVYNRIILKLLKPIIKYYKRITGQKVSDLKHREYTLREAENLLKENGFEIETTIYYNFKIIFHPFDKIFPKLTVWQSKLFEKLDKTFLKSIGTGFIISAKKT
jgi:ubiquinone/menaquinone biosynthesis C-methylase UbiE